MLLSFLFCSHQYATAQTQTTGKAKIGTSGVTYAGFGHKDQWTPQQTGFRQSSIGHTFVGTPAGRGIYLTVNGDIKFRMLGDGNIRFNNDQYFSAGNAVMSSGTFSNRLAHFSNNAWFGNSSWRNRDTNEAGALMQIDGGKLNFFHTGSGDFLDGSDFTLMATLNADKFGIGIGNPDERVHVKSTGPRAMMKFSNSHYESSMPNQTAGFRIGVDGPDFRIEDKNGYGMIKIFENLEMEIGHPYKKTTMWGKFCVRPSPTSAACPDYVFEPDYKLRSIEELEAYIQANKHLPGVKSAKEIEEAGSVEFIGMSYSLLEKIEELTLYTIDQEKRLQALETENAKLRAQSDAK